MAAQCTHGPDGAFRCLVAWKPCRLELFYSPLRVGASRRHNDNRFCSLLKEGYRPFHGIVTQGRYLEEEDKHDSVYVLVIRRGAHAIRALNVGITVIQ